RASGGRRYPQYFRSQQRAGTARHGSADRDHRQRGDCRAERAFRRSHRADGHHDAGHGRLRDHSGDPRGPATPPYADSRADGKGHEGRPRKMPGGGSLRLSREARQHTAITVHIAQVAASISVRTMTPPDKVNILLVDDQQAKLLSHEVILAGIGENLLKARSAREAFEYLLKNDIALILIDVCMPDLDGFELAAMIREHPRFQNTAIIFVSAVMMAHLDQLRGYELGGVDYVPVPVVPELLRAKVKVFIDLYRKTRQLEQFNADLERRVEERTAELRKFNEELELRIEERTR